MIGNNPALHSRTLVSASAAVGVDLPAPVVAALERTARITEAAWQTHPGQDALVEAITAALDAGRDPAADRTVQRVLTAQQISHEGITPQVQNLVEEQLRAQVAAHADAVVEAWRPAFDQAATDLRAAHAALGGIALDDTTSVVMRGGDAAAHWAAAQQASRTLDTINGAWLALGGLTRMHMPNPLHPALRFAEASPEVWLEHQLGRRKLSPWEAIGLGLDLSLPTFAEYRQRVSVLQAGLTALEAQDAPVDREREANKAWARRMSAAGSGGTAA